MGSKLGCIRSTPTETQSISENDFECLASTSVKSPVMDKRVDDRPSYEKECQEKTLRRQLGGRAVLGIQPRRSLPLRVLTVWPR
jgi:hypothetical protein